MLIKISDIIISERQRIDLGDIPALAYSIQRFGLIQDILVEKLPNGTYQLIAGRRRLAAHVHLKLERIFAKTTKDLTELDRQVMELEEDTKRKARNWQELCLTYHKLHRLKGYNDSKWSVQKLAAMTDHSVGYVQEYLSIANALEATRGQKDDWEKALWACDGIRAAMLHLMMRQENAAVDEIARRKKEVRIRLGQEQPQVPSIPKTYSTIEDVDEDNVPVVLEKKVIELFNRLPKKGECQYGIFIDDDFSSDIRLLASNGCAILWFSSFEKWNYRNRYYKSNNIYCLNFPLVWNILKGPSSINHPFMESYKFGLFLAMPDYKPYEEGISTPAVHTCPFGIIQIIEYSIDAMVKEERGVKIWASTSEVAEEIVCAYHIPVTPADMQQVKEYYLLINRNNVEFKNI